MAPLPHDVWDSLGGLIPDIFAPESQALALKNRIFHRIFLEHQVCDTSNDDAQEVSEVLLYAFLPHLLSY